MTRQTLLTLAAGCCTLSLLSVSCEQQAQEKDRQESSAGKKAVPIKVYPIVTQKVTDWGEWFGYIRGREDTDIYPRITGFLQEQCYKDGQRVKEGDVLFRIDPEIFQAQYDQALASLEAAKATRQAAQTSLDKAKLDLERYEKLIVTNAVSAKELDDARQTFLAAKANVDAADATIEQQEAAVRKAKIDLDYCVVRAPYSGIVGEALAFKGDLISSSTKLANMTLIDPVYVRFSLNSSELVDEFRRYGIKNTDSHQAVLPDFSIVLDNGETYPLKGKLLAMESKVNANGLIDVQGEIANPDGLLRAGMPVRVRVPLDEKEAMLVPEVAIRTVMRQSFILAVDKSGVPHMLPVTLDGTYTIDITEPDGYRSQQKMVAIRSRGKALSQYFREMGYEKASEVPVVADADNSVQAVNVSTANNRLAEGEKPGTIVTTPLSFRPTVPPAIKKAVEEARAARAGKAQPKPDPSTMKPTLPPFPVKVATIVQQDVAKESEWFGKLRGVNESVLRAQVSGFLLDQHFEDGAIVKKGDLLYTIDPAPYEAALAEARGNLSAAKASAEQIAAQVEMYSLDLKRYRELNATSPGAIETKIITDTTAQLRAEEANLLKAQANIKLMEATVRQAEINLGYTKIYAPFDGRVGIHEVSKGDLVDATAGTPLVNISSIDPVRVDITVPGSEALIGLTRFNQAAIRAKGKDKPRLTFDLVLEDGSVYPAKGHVVATDNALSESTGTLKVIGHVDNVDGGLRSGMAVRVRAGLDTIEGAYLVPARAPLFDKGIHTVMLLDDRNAPVMLPVTLGPLINLSVTGADGKSVVQPMQVIDVDRRIASAVLMAVEEVPTLEALVFREEGVKSWQELLLRRNGVKDMRALAEKLAGEALPDDAPAQAGVKDWEALVLHNAAAADFRELALHRDHAVDELDLYARKKGYKDYMQLSIARLGIKEPGKARVVAEGSLLAAMSTLTANTKAGANVNTLTPIDFIYQAPQTVVPSVTASEEDTAQLGESGSPAPGASAPAAQDKSQDKPAPTDAQH